jgi:predicted dehydrogenase
MKSSTPLPRRSFLKLLAAGSLGAAAFPSIVRAQTVGLGSPAPSDLINIGFIGLGGQGMGLMRNALNNPTARVVAVCEVDSTRLDAARKRVDDHYKQPAGNCAAYLDYLELLVHPGLDAVVIATPDHWHALQTVHAARAGKHIYVEKPAATSISEGRAMADAVLRAGVVGQIGSMQRSSGEFQRVVELTRNGFLGDIKKITVGLPSGPGPRPVPDKDLQSWPAPPPTLDYERWLGPAPALPYRAERTHYQWRWQFAFGGGQVADWIGHHYDIGALAANVTHLQPVALETISGKFENPGAFVETATAYSFTARYANGIAIDTASSNRSGVRVEGSEGWVYATRGALEHSSETLRRVIIPSHGYKISGGTGSHMDDFLSAIKTRATPRYPVLEGHNIAAVAHLANAALRSGVPDLRWDPATESLLDRPEADRFLRRTYRAPYILPV